MAYDDSAGEKTEPATPRKRRKAREDGQVARSQDLSSAILLLTAVIVLFFYAENVFGQLSDLMALVLGRVDEFRITEVDMVSLGRRGLAIMILMLAPLLAAVVVASLAVNLAQVGLVVTFEPMAFKPNRLDPISGLKRLLSLRSLVRLFASLMKLTVIGLVLYFSIVDEIDKFFLLIDQSVEQLMAFLGASVFRLAIRTAIALLILALLDYAYQKWQHEQDLRMTKQEVKDELKMMEGDPRIRARRRQIAIQLAQQRMMSAIPDADVVVTNPTHLAVALSYERSMSAPRVVAKGAGRVAERIRDLAALHAVPLVEKKDLAQALFRACEVGQDVPEELWQAVAEVLAFVYQLGKSEAML